MSSPQSILYNLDQKLEKVCKVLEGDDDIPNISQRLANIEAQQMNLLLDQQRLMNIMNLILKYLSKDEKDI